MKQYSELLLSQAVPRELLREELLVHLPTTAVDKHGVEYVGLNTIAQFMMSGKYDEVQSRLNMMKVMKRQHGSEVTK